MKKVTFKAGLLIILAVLFTACEKEDSQLFEKPVVTTISEVENIPAGSTGLSAIFKVKYDSRLSATYAATGIGVNISNSTGSIVKDSIIINYDVGDSSGAASITLTVTDSNGQTDDATLLFNINEQQSQIRVTANITNNTTWTSDKVYVLGGRITVEAEATLAIEPGTIIKGEAGTGANATALLIARGGKIMAEGTEENPIIFTSVADEIQPEDITTGNFGSPNLDPDINGLWGGVIILGRAPISASNESGDINEIQIEGIPTSDQNGLYGGNNPEDNSGIFKYVSIRHGGSNIGAGNEINGLTLGGVGSGTTIEHIEVVANQDDGIEWFGGTVSVNNVVVWNAGDDAIDTDQSWAGVLNNFVVIAPGDHNFELDGPEGTFKAGHIIQNGTVVANDPENNRFSSDLINTDDNSIVQLKNIYFTMINAGQKINRVTHEEGEVLFEGIELDIPEADLQDYVNGNIPSGIKAVSNPTVGADVSVFGWTWAFKAGILNNL